MKVYPSKGIHGVREALSTYRRNKERKVSRTLLLGALFEAIVPPILCLIQAYGNVRLISSRSGDRTQKNFNIGNIFAAQAGIGGLSIGAAANSGLGPLAIHLLPCMLARIWKGHETISLWVELVDQWKQEIRHI